MPKITITDSADFEEFTVRLSRIVGQPDLQLTLGDHGDDLSVQITNDDLRTLAGWLTQQAAKLNRTSTSVEIYGRCIAHNPKAPNMQCSKPAGHIGDDHGYAGIFWPQEVGNELTDRCGATHNEDNAYHQCQLPADHQGPHSVKFGPSWPQERDEVPMGGRCGNVRYWRPTNESTLDNDLRSVCTKPAGHKGDYHAGPDQTGRDWTWLRGAECNATKFFPGGALVCTLTCGHTGMHEQDGRTWPNPLQPGEGNCYQRHELAPGVHQDIPHTHEPFAL